MRKIAAYSCYLGLGANLGNRVKVLDEAIERLAAADGIEIIAVSSYYETAPWGWTEQPPFVNAALKIRTTLEPLDLLTVCQAIETQLGRKREKKWGPRTLDIDLLYALGKFYEMERLRLPHPYLKERAFVLVPLAEIADDVLFEGKTFAYWQTVCPDHSSVQKISSKCRNSLKKS